ncbi:MAG: hypothetical protein ACRER2_17890 [Methylococcales bacterium]
MNPEQKNDELRPEYDFDFSKAVRGKYYKRYIESSNIIVLDPDVAEVFRNSEAVNQALRAMLRFTEQAASLTRRSSGASPAELGPSPTSAIRPDILPIFGSGIL